MTNTRNIDYIKNQLKIWDIENYIILEKPFFNMEKDGIVIYPEKEETRIHYFNQCALLKTTSLEVHTYKIDENINNLISYIKESLQPNNFDSENLLNNNIADKKILYVYNITDKIMRILF